MRRSTDRVLTTHVGSLPGPMDVWGNPEVSDERLAEAVSEVVQKQRDTGIDIVNEGELTKHGTWTSFMTNRLSGFEKAAPGQRKISQDETPDRKEFDQFYKAALERGTLFEQTGTAKMSADNEDRTLRICREPITYTGQAELQREIDLLKSSLGEQPVGDAFLSTVAPASYEPNVANEFYDKEKDFLFALAEALGQEYEMIANAGLLVQVDDAFIPALWERLGVKVGLEEYLKFIEFRVELLNHALRNVPREQTRYHLCWGSWHGPHAHDIPLESIIDVVMKVDTGAYLVESANVRHEHEWRVWDRNILTQQGKILIPGVVSHATTLIEHPDLVADRITRFTNLLGAENVIASTDCGLGARCHPQIAWAKLKALAEGAERASKQVFG